MSRIGQFKKITLYSSYSRYIIKVKIMNATTIQIKDETLGRLKFFKEFNKESYDEIINKVLDEVEEGELTDEALKDIIEAKKEIREGKGQRIEDVAKELGIKL